MPEVPKFKPDEEEVIKGETETSNDAKLKRGPEEKVIVDMDAEGPEDVDIEASREPQDPVIVDKLNKYKKELQRLSENQESSKKSGAMSLAGLGMIETGRKLEKYLESLSEKEIWNHRKLIEEIKNIS